MENTLNVNFTKLEQPTEEIAASFTRWENNPALIPFMRPNKNQEDLDKRQVITASDLAERLEHHQVYLIHLNNDLIGEMNYIMDPGYLYKKETGTAWIGIDIGEEIGRGKGIGFLAMQYLEEQIKLAGLKRIELGVFEFNMNAVKLYQKSGYMEIGRVKDFTYWQGKMWQDIRMEKYINI